LPKATRREWIGLAVISLPCVLYSMDLSVLNLAVPQLTADLQPSASQLLWIVDIYGFLLAGFLITMGTLGDRIGRRRLLLIGAAAFGATSVLAAFANSAETLIAARALLGIAAATLAPSTLSLIRNMFLDEHQRTLAIGIWVGSFSAGGAIGPVIGGVLLEHFWWGSVFLLAVPIMALLLIIGPVLLPEFRDEHAGRLDLVSAGMSTSGVLAVIYGIKRIAEAGLHANAVFMILVGVAIAVLFVRRQKRLSDPLIDVRLFRSRVIAAALSINIMALFIAFGSFLFIAQYLQLVLGMSPLEAGLWSAPSGIVFVVGSAVTPFAVRRFGPAFVMSGGLLICALGFAFLTQTALRDEIWIFMTGFLLMCLGLAPVGTVSTDLVMGAAPPERAGAASGVSETSFEFGGALGIAVLGSIITALYRTQMGSAALSGIDTASIEVARDTLGAAVSTAMQLQGEQRELLLWTARNAFMESFRITSAICVVVSIVAAVVAMVVIRRQAAYVGTQESSKITTSLPPNEAGTQVAD
jgi:MFS transporter, DHA2 family, multidrug resistance protein